MGDYSIQFVRLARKELESLPDQFMDRVLNKIEALVKNPRPSGVVKLHGQSNLWRLRVGDYRVVYSIDDNVKKIEITVIRHRRDVYRGL